MLSEVLYPLRDAFIGFNLFKYITFRTAGAAITSLVLTWILLPPYIKRFAIPERISEDVPENHRAKEGTPSSGGIIILAAVLVATLLWARPLLITWLAVGSMAYLGLMGLADDLLKRKGDKKRGMPKRVKLLFQFTLAVLVAIGLYYAYPDKAFVLQFPFVKTLYLNLGFFYALFILFVFVGTVNSVNLTDGLDGLAAGAAVPVFVALGGMAYAAGHAKLSAYLQVLNLPGAGELAVFSGAVLGALMGFLWFNAYPAEVFMGDVGSQALGGAMAMVAIGAKQEITLAIAAGLFVLEALSVIIQVAYFRLTGGKRVFRCAPLHHHFELGGWPEPKVVVRFWVLSALFATFALATLKLR